MESSSDQQVRDGSRFRREAGALRVLLGVSGGIAAYKAAELVRRLREGGYEVRCVMTSAARAFLQPLTLEVLSGRPVLGEEYLQSPCGGEELHVTAAAWSDVLCVAPATANTLGRLALGLAEDLLSTTALVFDGPVVLAPSMHAAMWGKEAVQHHVSVLRERGAVFVGPEIGSLASGEHGPGRMAAPEAIVEAVAAAASGSRRLAGRTVLVTAGPTREPLDPVRYLGNRSSGKMGFALAAEAAARGARSVLVAGPVGLETPAGVERLDVETAEEMKAAVERWMPQADVLLMAAAVADFRPRRALSVKIKKRSGPSRLELDATPDILAGLRRLAAPGALLVGFAAETGELEAEARLKLEGKDLDFVVANEVGRPDSGFDSDYNEVVVLGRDGRSRRYPRRSKRRLAGDLLDLLEEALARRDASVPSALG